MISRVMERSVAEIQPHDVLRTQDATLTAIVDAITREAHQQGIGGALYIEAFRRTRAARCGIVTHGFVQRIARFAQDSCPDYA